MEIVNKDLVKILIKAVREDDNQISEDTIFNFVESFERRMVNILKVIEIESLTYD